MAPPSLGLMDFRTSVSEVTVPPDTQQEQIYFVFMLLLNVMTSVTLISLLDSDLTFPDSTCFCAVVAQIPKVTRVRVRVKVHMIGHQCVSYALMRTQQVCHRQATTIKKPLQLKRPN